ncbi:MAG TPA: D-xylose ABC transporter ATP-binding protein [Treponema sp.]|nr:D-xylose ABC transporter ATP-binding protein [Treponema sp.]
MNVVMKGITKRFGDALVLDNAEFSLTSGEIHALMGENGAGKSTMMKILTGVYTKDSGSIIIDGKEVCFSRPKEAEEAGICFVYQELNSLLDMTVEENIFLGREIFGKFGVLNKKMMKARTKEVLGFLGVNLNPDALLQNLSVGQRQLVEIAKAFLVKAEVIILDEPTAALTENEVEKLFEIIRLLQKKGVSFIYISHRMEEIFRICNRITVMRDGRYINSLNVKDTSPDELIRLMTGREIGNLFQKKSVPQGDVLLEVTGLSKKGMFSDISFKVHAGEILGIAGLMGAGRSEIMKTIFGSYSADSGKLFVRGKEIPLKKYNPQKARALGIAFITEDRREEGLMIDVPITNNLDLTNFSSVTSAKILMNSGKEKKLSADAISEFRIRCTGGEHICGNLSGGNQQKVVFAKWLYTNPKILILDEPTRGVDVGAKQEIYGIITKLVQKGTAVIMVSSELPEVLGMSDRILVIHEGRVAGLVERSAATQDKIMLLATGGKING